MSLSQKHEGKVLVPWFNFLEWEAVYKLIYSDEKNWNKALTLLQIWKQRTPLLSAGVEGTLILVEALMIDTTKLSNYEIVQIYSTSLMRFLNLCAANSDKQGSFYKTAMKNDLPQWLVTMRHEIAHSHKLPSKSMLELSLKFCLDWLQNKYWQTQHHLMIDYEIKDEKSNGNVNLNDLLNVYAVLSEKVYCPAKMYNDKKLNKKLNQLFRGLTKRDYSDRKLLDVVCKKLNEVFQNKDRRELMGRIAPIIFNSEMLFRDEAVEDAESKEICLDATSINIWERFLNILHKHKLLGYFMIELNNVLNSNTLHAKLASLWFKEICTSLVDQDMDNKKCTFKFTEKNNSIVDKNILNEILSIPNEESRKFMNVFLKLQQAPEGYINDVIKIQKAAFGQDTLVEDDKIYTVEDLNVNLKFNKLDEMDADVHVQSPKRMKRSRWERIEDTTPFQNCPFGVLPTQSRQFNPVLHLS